MFKIKTYNNIAQAGLACFPADEFEVSAEEVSPDAILLRSHKMHDMDLPDSLVAVARAGAESTTYLLKSWQKTASWSSIPPAPTPML